MMLSPMLIDERDPAFTKGLELFNLRCVDDVSDEARYHKSQQPVDTLGGFATRIRSLSEDYDPGFWGRVGLRSSVLALYAVPPLLLLLVALVAAPVVACGGQWLLHRRLDLRTFFVDNDVAGFIIAVVGTLYAVVLGFTIVEVWEHYEAARLNAWSEAASLGDVWHNAVGLPPALRLRIRNDMVGYVDVMMKEEWQAMRQGSFSVRGDELLMDAATAIGTFVPRNAGQSNAQASIINQLNELHDARGRRLAVNAEGVSGFQWLVLWIGAVVVLAFCYVFSVSHLNAHMLMTGSVAILIATMFVLLFELQYPFRSALGIAPTPWQAMNAHIRYMDRMPGPMAL